LRCTINARAGFLKNHAQSCISLVRMHSTGVVRILGIGKSGGRTPPLPTQGVFGKEKRVSPGRGEILQGCSGYTARIRIPDWRNARPPERRPATASARVSATSTSNFALPKTSKRSRQRAMLKPNAKVKWNWPRCARNRNNLKACGRSPSLA